MVEILFALVIWFWMLCHCGRSSFCSDLNSPALVGLNESVLAFWFFRLFAGVLDSVCVLTSWVLDSRVICGFAVGCFFLECDFSVFLTIPLYHLIAL